MSVLHVMVPGLARRHLEMLLSQASLRDRPPARTADLVVGFPATIEACERAILGGRGLTCWEEMNADAVVGSRLLDHVDAVLRVDAPEFAGPPFVGHLRWMRLTDALADVAPAAEIDAISELAALLRRGIEAHDAVLVSGAPTMQPVTRIVEIDDGSHPLRRVGALAFSNHRVDPMLIERWLDTPGVERALSGDGLRSWGLPAERGTVLVAETGWSFTPGPWVSGHREIVDPAHGGVVLAWGARGKPWPAAVHDVRVGATLAIAAGLDATAAEDDPLPWNDPIRPGRA